MKERLVAVDRLVDSSTCVVSTSQEALIGLIKDAVIAGRSATFYVSSEIAAQIIAWYWTPERKIEYGVADISEEERYRIKQELNLEDAILFSNRTPCEKCGEVYGAYEFIQQGLEQHGRSFVDDALSMTDAALIRVNPSEVAVCRNCGEKITKGGELVDERIVGGIEVPHYYGGTRAYAGCCRGGQLQR